MDFVFAETAEPEDDYPIPLAFRPGRDITSLIADAESAAYAKQPPPHSLHHGCALFATLSLLAGRSALTVRHAKPGWRSKVFLPFAKCLCIDCGIALPDAFEACATFSGQKQGFVFKNGSSGVGAQ